MYFTLKKPCNDCPFLKKGGIRLTDARVVQIAGYMLDSQGATFACHKTTVEDPRTGDRKQTKDSQHCAGGLIFAEKHEVANQMVRIAERLGLYDARVLMKDKKVVDTVFDSLEQMREENRLAESGRRRRRKS